MTQQMTSQLETKKWKTAATCATYDEARVLREELSEKHKLVKIKRGGKGGTIFRVKTWDEPISAKSDGKSKKKNPKRNKKNVDKTVRNRQERE